MKNKLVKILLALVVTVVACSLMVGAVSYGDADGDEEITNRDAARILQHLAGWQNVEIDLDACNVNGDGKVNVRDAARVLQYVAGWDVELVGPEIDETETQNTRQNYRIVTNKEKIDDENGDWRYEYDVYNPNTGRIEIAPGIQTATKASGLDSLVIDFEKGALVELEEGFVNDTLQATTLVDNILFDSSLLWVKSFDSDENCMTVVPVDDISPADENCKECLTDELESYDGGFKSIDYANDNTLSFDENKVYVDENTAVNVVKNSDFDNLFYYPATALANLSVLANPNQNYMCYNSKALDENNDFVTGYADYLKVYVAADKKADGTCVADFVTIVVTDTDSSALNNSCPNH